MSNGRARSADDESKLRRLVASGYTDIQIGEDMNRHPDTIRAWRRELNLKPGQSPIFTAMMARINARRRMSKLVRA